LLQKIKALNPIEPFLTNMTFSPSLDMSRVSDTMHELKQQLMRHQLYQRIDSMEALRCFMESHVFAVWDFMSLVHAMKRHLSPQQKLWTPGPCPANLRTVYEILRDEETDCWPHPSDGTIHTTSHFEMYRMAMNEVGASTQAIDELVCHAAASTAIPEDVAQWMTLPDDLRSFLNLHLRLVREDHFPAISAAFYYGREAILPDLFEQVLAQPWFQQSHAPLFVTYCQRHIELDGDSHGDLARQIFQWATENDAQKEAMGMEAAVQTLQARLAMLDGVLRRMDSHS